MGKESGNNYYYQTDHANCNNSKPRINNIAKNYRGKGTRKNTASM